MSSKKQFFLIAGANGSGKTTIAKTILTSYNCPNFINADEIARSINPLQPDKVKIKAGKEMVRKIKECILNKENFCVETTLNNKSYLKKIKELKKQNYEIYLFFIYLQSVEIAIKRVQNRIAKGGHKIPVELIKKRYNGGLKNLFNSYWLAVDFLFLFSNNIIIEMVYNRKNSKEEILNSKIYNTIKKHNV